MKVIKIILIILFVICFIFATYIYVKMPHRTNKYTEFQEKEIYSLKSEISIGNKISKSANKHIFQKYCIKSDVYTDYAFDENGLWKILENVNIQYTCTISDKIDTFLNYECPTYTLQIYIDDNGIIIKTYEYKQYYNVL